MFTIIEGGLEKKVMVKLDLGCGKKKKKGSVGIDTYNWAGRYPKGEFLQGRVPEILKKFGNNSVEEVRAKHFLEHISQDKVIYTINEVYRILKVKGLFDITVPPTTGRGAFCDPTHVSFWNDLSFRYYDMEWDRELSVSYGIECNFKCIKKEQPSENKLRVILRKAEI